jgi:osmotically-inducible protein OsmY
MKLRNFLTFSALMLITNLAFADYKHILRDINNNINALENLGKRDIEFRYAASGLIVLEGQVASESSKTRVEEAVKLVKGVKRVENNLKVVPSSPGVNVIPSTPKVLTDSEITQNIEKAFSLSGEINTSLFSYQVRDGIVYISGSMPNFRAVDKTLSVLLMTEGVKDVESSLTVSGKEYLQAIK